jgi:hypothetical protein
VLDTDFWCARFECNNAVAAIVELKNTTTRTWEVGVSGSTSFGTVPAGSWYLYDISANLLRLHIDTAGTATFAGQIVGQAGAVLTGTVAGNVRALRMQTSGSTRWEVGPGFDAESGSNVGSTFWITRWSDAGAFLGTPIAIDRATGRATFENTVVVPSGSVSSCSVAPFSDLNTGLYFPSADVAAWVTNGTERVRVGSGGRVQFFAADEKFGVQLNKGSTGNGPFIGSDGADILTISTAGGAERVRVDASGNVGIGTSAGVVLGSERLSVDGGAVGIKTSAPVSFGIWNTNSSGTRTYTYYYIGTGTLTGSITTDGTTTSYNTTSDYRLKTVIGGIADATRRLQSLLPCEYVWNSTGQSGEGFLAHELAQSVPHAVTGEKDAVNDDGSVSPQQVDLAKVVPLLVAALQESNARIAALEERING